MTLQDKNCEDNPFERSRVNTNMNSIENQFFSEKLLTCQRSTLLIIHFVIHLYWKNCIKVSFCIGITCLTVIISVKYMWLLKIETKLLFFHSDVKVQYILAENMSELP